MKNKYTNKSFSTTFLLSILFCFFSYVGQAQYYEIDYNGDNFIVKLANSGANVLIDAGDNLTTGLSNTLIGSDAGQMLTTQSDNTFIGKQAGFECTGIRNVVIGSGAANGQNAPGLGSNNIIIGHEAGWFEQGDNKLYIESSDIPNPLIYGEFDNDLVKINGTFHVQEVMKLKPLSTTPTCAAADKGTLYMDDGTNKLRLCNGTAWIDLN